MERSILVESLSQYAILSRYASAFLIGLLNAGKGYADFLQEKTEKEAKQLEKEEQDRKHKNLQIEDLEFRLKTVEDMQERQKRFWAKQNISLFISGLSLIVAFIALIAKCSSKSQ